MDSIDGSNQGYTFSCDGSGGNFRHITVDIKTLRRVFDTGGAGPLLWCFFIMCQQPHVGGFLWLFVTARLDGRASPNRVVLMPAPKATEYPPPHCLH